VFLVYYCFFVSYGVPDAASALPTGEPVPALTLSNHLDEPVDLAQLARGDAVLVFFRGHW
jgi:peroxiredoxin